MSNNPQAFGWYAPGVTVSKAPSLNLALITALNIASEWRKLQRQQEELGHTINRTAQRVSAKLGALGRSVRKGEDIARR